MNTDDREDKYLTREKLKRQVDRDRGWYFITFASELTLNRSYGFTLFDEPFVLFKDKNDNLVCCLLASREDDEIKDCVEMRLLEVVEKQGEIWFYRGKV